jgi:Reverse transcriptase (RNA-dependent DNA polymerase).
MELPEGFEEPGYVCRLRRSLYGLKQAPRIWYQCAHRVLAAHGFTMAQSDNCVFYKSNCVICVYVDDFLVAAATSHEIDQVQRALEKEFRLNDLGTPRSFLGIQLDYHADGAVSIHQQPVHPKGSLRLWHGNLPGEIYPYESQARLESPSRRRTSG